MPRVPEAQQQIRDAALPGVRVSAAGSPQSFGAEVGQTLSRAGLTLYQREIDAADHAAVMEAETAASRLQLQILGNVQKRRGKDAVDAQDYADQEFAVVEEQLSGTLSNSRQRAMFQSVVRSQREGLSRSALQHSRAELDKFETQTYQDNVAQAIDAARMHAQDPVQVAADKDILRQKVELRAQRLGLDSDMQKAELTQHFSKLNTAVIEGLLTKGEDQRARAYYAKMKEGEETNRTRVDEQTGDVTTLSALMQFTAKDREAVEKALDEGSTRGMARRTANALVAEGIATAEDRQARLDKLNELADSGRIDEKTFEATKQRLEHAFNTYDQFQVQAGNERFKGAVALIDKTWKARPDLPVREMIPAPDYAKLSVGERSTLDQYVHNLRDPGKVATDLETWVKINAMKDADIAKMTPADMMAVANKLDEGDRDRLLTRWNGILNAKDGKKDAKFEKLLSNQQVLTNAMELSGFFDMETPKTQWPTEHKRLWNKVENKTAEALAQIPDGAPLKVIQDTVQGVVDKEIGIKFKVDPGFFSRNKDVPAALIDEQKGVRSITVPMKEIPVPEQDAIKGLLREAKKPISSNKIERIYALKRMHQAGKLKRQDLIDQTRTIIEE